MRQNWSWQFFFQACNLSQAQVTVVSGQFNPDSPSTQSKGKEHQTVKSILHSGQTVELQHHVPKFFSFEAYIAKKNGYKMVDRSVP